MLGLGYQWPYPIRSHQARTEHQVGLLRAWPWCDAGFNTRQSFRSSDPERRSPGRVGGMGHVGIVAGTHRGLGEKNSHVIHTGYCEKASTTLLQFEHESWRGGFFRYFFRSLLYFCTRLAQHRTPQHLNGPHRFLRRCAGVGPYFPTTLSFSRNSNF